MEMPTWRCRSMCWKMSSTVCSFYWDVWYHVFTCVTCIRVAYLVHAHDLFRGVIWLTPMCVTHRDFVACMLSVLKCVIWLVHMYSYVWHSACICVACLIRMCDVTHVDVWRMPSTISPPFTITHTHTHTHTHKCTHTHHRLCAGFAIGCHMYTTHVCIQTGVHTDTHAHTHT